MLSSIRKKLFALTSAVLIVVVTSITAFLTTQQVNSLHEAVREKADSYARMAAVESASALAFDDKTTAREVFEAAAMDKDVRAITLFRADGSVLYRHIAREGADVFDDAAENAGVVIATAPVVAREGPRGRLELELSTRRVTAKVPALLAVTASASFVAIVFGCIAVWLGGASFGRRIARVTEHAGAVANDEVREPLASTSPDEIGVLSRAFDTMVEKIEQRVVERTQELEETNVALFLLERETREKEALTRAVVENAADGIFTVAESDEVLGFNAACETIFGVPASDVIGKPITDVLPRGVRVGRSEMTVHTRDGRDLQLDVRITEVIEQGRLLRVGLVRDLSDEKRVAAQVTELNKQLVDASRMAGMADVASGILHNVGNVLNSVNVSATVLDDTVRRSSVESIGKLAQLIAQHDADLGAFLTQNPKGKKVPEFLAKTAEKLAAERATLTAEIAGLRKNVDHIREIVSMQQEYTRKSGVTEQVDLRAMLDDAIAMGLDTKGPGELEIVREMQSIEPVILDRHRTMQILVNLVRNARHAVRDSGRSDPRVTVRLSAHDNRIKVVIADNGVGISPQSFAKLFQQGFTTKRDGHGYGLHSSANAAKELGGRLFAESPGEGHGASFTLELPHTPVISAGHGSSPRLGGEAVLGLISQKEVA
jgi:PAS domain S-box-containing protein